MMLEKWEKVEIRGWTVDPDSGCWEYSGARLLRGRGYGVIKHGKGVMLRVHRISYEHHHGPIPEGLIIRHKCDNPPCMNPEHLEVGTYADNARDREIRGRGVRGTTKISREEAEEIREKYASGGISQQKLADLYGMKQANVSRIIRREIWR